MLRKVIFIFMHGTITSTSSTCVLSLFTARMKNFTCNWRYCRVCVEYRIVIITPISFEISHWSFNVRLRILLVSHHEYSFSNTILNKHWIVTCISFRTTTINFWTFVNLIIIWVDQHSLLIKHSLFIITDKVC